MHNENDDSVYSRYFHQLATDGNWVMQFNSSHSLLRLLPTSDDFTRENLIYPESVTISFSTPNGFYLKRGAYDSFQLQYTTSGQGILNYDSREYLLSPGDCFFIDCKKAHELTTVSHGPWIHHGIQVHGHQLPAMFGHFYCSGSVRASFGDSQDIPALFENIAKAAYSQLPSSSLLLNQLLTELITRIMLCNQKLTKGDLPEKIRNICNYIERNFDTIQSIDDIARDCYISKYYLCHEFKKLTGRTLTEYINQIRIKTAKLLLLSTDMPITDISLKIGYSSINYFYAVFKKLEKTTPFQYRRQHDL